MTSISYRNYLIAAFSHYESEKMAQLAASMPVEHGKRGIKLQTCKGDQRVLDIRRVLNELGYERSKMQRQFHESFLQAVCLHLYRYVCMEILDLVFSTLFSLLSVLYTFSAATIRTRIWRKS